MSCGLFKKTTKQISVFEIPFGFGLFHLSGDRIGMYPEVFCDGIFYVCSRASFDVATTAHGNNIERSEIFAMVVIRRFFPAVDASKLLRFFDVTFANGLTYNLTCPGSRLGDSGRTLRAAIWAGAITSAIPGYSASAQCAMANIRFIEFITDAFRAGIAMSHVHRTAPGTLSLMSWGHLRRHFFAGNVGGCCPAKNGPIDIGPEVFADNFPACGPFYCRASLGRNPRGFPFMDSLGGNWRVKQFANAIEAKNVDCCLKCAHAHIQLQVDLNVKFISTLEHW